MSTTPPTPKPTVKPWHEAAAREIEMAIGKHEHGIGPWPDGAAIIAKHDPATANETTPAPTSGRDHTHTAEGTQ